MRRLPAGGRWHTSAFIPSETGKDRQLPKPNYAFAKRQRDLAKKQKREEKLKKKVAETPAGDDASATAAAETPKPAV
jgi:hypothetical protein